MKTSKIFKEVNEKQELSLTELHERTGIMKCNIRKQMANDDLRLSTVVKFANCFGLSLVLEDKNNKYKIK